MARLFISAFQERSCHHPVSVKLSCTAGSEAASQHSGNISHDGDVIICGPVGQLFIAEVGDMAAEWVAECLISSSALQTGKLPVCVSVSCWCVSVQRFGIMQKRLTLPFAITQPQPGSELHRRERRAEPVDTHLEIKHL